MRARDAAALAVAAALASGCATTRVHTSDPEARILFDGRPVPRSGRVFAFGPPHTARILVVTKDGRRERALASRSFSWKTANLVVRGILPCAVFCWTYPEDVFIPLPPPKPKASWDDDLAASPWSAPPVDRWALPPPAPGDRKTPAAMPSPSP